MNLFGYLLTLVTIVTAMLTYYFWTKAQKIADRNEGFRDLLFRPSGSDPETMNEWQLHRKYSKYQVYSFIGGIIVIVLLFVLQAIFNWFG